MKKQLLLLAPVIAAVVAVGDASAASLLTADIATQFTDTTGDMTSVGGDVIKLAVLAMGIRWVKATFF